MQLKKESACLFANRLVTFQSNAVNRRIRVGVGLVFFFFILRRHYMKHTRTKRQDSESYLK